MASIISAGTSAGTALNLTGDTSGALALQTNNGTTALTIDTSQNVGIGTTTPSTKLTILTSTSNNGIRLNDGTVNTILFNTSSSNGSLGTTTNHPFAFYTNNTEKMRIDSTGNVGIGTVTPNSKLDVEGGYLQVGYNSNPYINLYNGTNGTNLKYVRLGQAAGCFVFETINDAYTTPVERMRVDNSGNVGINTTAPQFKLQVNQTSITAVSPSVRLTPQIYARGYAGGSTYYSGIGFSMFEHTNGYWGSGVIATDDTGLYGSSLCFYTSTGSASPTPTEKMRIASSGRVYINNTGSFGGMLQSTGISGVAAAVSFKPGQNGDGTCEWYNQSNGYVSAVTVNASSVVYGTSSDYRLKENVKPMTGALSVVSKLKPCTFDWIATKEAANGFIAHELQEVMPAAVAGEKDAVDAEGNPKYQGVDASFLVATLTAAIQEQQALITQLQADVAALKGAK